MGLYDRDYWKERVSVPGEVRPRRRKSNLGSILTKLILAGAVFGLATWGLNRPGFPGDC